MSLKSYAERSHKIAVHLSNIDAHLEQILIHIRGMQPQSPNTPSNSKLETGGTKDNLFAMFEHTTSWAEDGCNDIEKKVNELAGYIGLHVDGPTPVYNDARKVV